MGRPVASARAVRLETATLTTRQWRSFVSAAALMGAVVLKAGVPLPAVVAGVLLAAPWTWKSLRLRG